MLKQAKRLGHEIGIFCALHAYGRQLNQHPYIHLSVTRGVLTQYDAWKPIFFKKRDFEKVWRNAVIRLLRDRYFQLQPNTLPSFGHIRAITQHGVVTSTLIFNVIGKCILPKRPEALGTMSNIKAVTLNGLLS
ncbi:transposase [Providencia rettgeri]|nr:transposase [Providencia rettgeri]MDH2379562.1 transposase [Providencia rettgeri]MDW7803598.1 transposase [Providencia rettgeri]